MLTSRRAETSLTTWIALAAVIVIIGSALGYFSIPNLSTQNVTTKTSNAGLVSVTKPLQITCFIALAGSNCGAATVSIYKGSTSLQLETFTASGSGVVTTGNSYQTGTALTIRVSGATCSTTCVTEDIPFTVPAMDPNSAISSANNIVSVYDVTLGSWTKVNTGTGGTTFTSGNTYSLGQFSGNTVTITTSISETTANAGYKSSYDISNLLNRYFVVQIDDGAGASSSTQYATVTGLAHTWKSGNTNYYFTVCPDGLSGTGVGNSFSIVQGSQSAGTADSTCAGSLSQQTIGNTVQGGTASFNWTVGLGSLTGGNTETFSIKTYYYADPAYFVTNSNLGPNAATTGSTFTILFHA